MTMVEDKHSRLRDLILGMALLLLTAWAILVSGKLWSAGIITAEGSDPLGLALQAVAFFAFIVVASVEIYYLKLVYSWYKDSSGAQWELKGMSTGREYWAALGIGIVIGGIAYTHPAVSWLPRWALIPAGIMTGIIIGFVWDKIVLGNFDVERVDE